METLLRIQKKLIPELLEVFQKRYEILKYVRLLQPIGRRSLAVHLGMTERILRGEVLFLKGQGFLDVNTSGMSLTVEGMSLITDLEDLMNNIFGLKDLEKKLQQLLNVGEVIVVAGDSDENLLVKRELGRACANRMKDCFQANNIIAVTGGSTLAAAAEMITPDGNDRDLLFLPARGGLGERVENQANNICAKMAENSSAHYRLLHVPDQVSEKMYESIVEEPSIKSTLDLIKSASMVVHGIGDAIIMANRRQAGEDCYEKLVKGHAVGEAFGYYFNEQGEIVHKIRTIGLQLDDLNNATTVIAVAGGSSKANAIEAVMKQGKDHILITDEGAAKKIIREQSLKNKDKASK